jgi:hypothetical protein
MEQPKLTPGLYHGHLIHRGTVAQVNPTLLNPIAPKNPEPMSRYQNYSGKSEFLPVLKPLRPNPLDLYAQEVKENDKKLRKKSGMKWVKVYNI